MRLRRLCMVKKSGKCAVDESVRESYDKGAEAREMLEIALLEAIKKHGTDRAAYTQVKDCTAHLKENYMEVFIDSGYLFFPVAYPASSDSEPKVEK